MLRILDMLEEIKAKAESLYNKGVIKKITKDYFIEHYASVKQELEVYQRDPAIATREKLLELADQIIQMFDILKSIEENQYVDKERTFFEELTEKFAEHEIVERYVLIRPVTYPSCRFKGDDRGMELFYLLLLPDDVNYLKKDLIGILAHEFAHLNQWVISLTRSMYGLNRKIGETIADILAYSAVECLFSYSCVNFVKNVVTVERANSYRPRHPSWVTRLELLNFYNDLLWQEDEISQRNADILWNVIKQLPSDPDDDVFRAHQNLRKDLQKEWAKYKIDEKVLLQLESLNEEEIEQLGEIPRKIWELVRDVRDRGSNS